MADEASSEPLIVEGRTVDTAETVERPPSKRPAHDSINGIADWTIGRARRITSGTAAIDEFSWRLYAAGLPLSRVSLHVGTLHPQYLGAAKMVVALHYGTVIYGNIGAADRLDFPVIGPSVNLVSRIEAVAKSLDLPLVVSDDFVAVYGE